MFGFIVGGTAITMLGVLFAKTELTRYLKIRRVKKAIFKKKLKNHKSDDSCMICLEDLDGTKKCRQLYCNHVYHSDCLYSWLKERPTCPLCNKNLITKDNQDIVTFLLNNHTIRNT